MTDSRLQELQEILEGRPSRFAFRMLRAIIDAWPDEPGRGEVYSRAKQVLRRWPSWCRDVSSRHRKMFAILEAPSWPLTRWLKVEPAPDEDGRSLIEAIVASPVASRLRGLSISLEDDLALERLQLRTSFRRLAWLKIGVGPGVTLSGLRALIREMLPGQVRTLELAGLDVELTPGVIDELVDGGHVGRFRGMILSGMHLGGLERFLERWRSPLSTIGRQPFTLESLGLLCRNAELASGLRSLDLPGVDFGDEGVAMLAACPHLARLERLNLYRNEISGEGLEPLGRAAFAASLRHLRLEKNPLGDAGWRRLAGLPLEGLRHLNLNRTNAGPRGAAALARGRGPIRPRTLSLSWNPIGDEGVSRLLSSQALRRVVSLHLNHVAKGPAAAEALALKTPGRLRTLSFGGDPIGPEGAEWLARSRGLGRLELMELNWSKLGDRGLASLAGSDAFPRLRRLFLAGNEIGPAGIRALAGSEAMATLRELGLYLNPIGDAGADAMAGSDALSRLVLLDLFNCQISPAGFAKLSRSPIASRLEAIKLDLDMAALEPWLSSPIARPVCRANPIEMP